MFLPGRLLDCVRRQCYILKVGQWLDALMYGVQRFGMGAVLDLRVLETIVDKSKP